MTVKYLPQVIYVCVVCRKYQGHQIVWCPRCGGKLICQKKTSEEMQQLIDEEGYRSFQYWERGES